VPSAFFVLAGTALLFAAAGLVLWQWAARRQARTAVGRHISQQVRIRAVAEEPAFDVLRSAGAAPAPAAAAALTDPWTTAAAEESAASRGGLAALALPGWLQNVVGMHTLVLAALGGIAICAVVFLFAGGVAAGAALLLLVLAGTFGLWLRLQQYRRKLAGQLPGFIDAMVRLIAIGNSTHAAFQLAIASTKAPLHGYLERAGSLVRAGADLDQALHQMARNVRIEEMYLLASILGLGVRYGGRSDVLLERVANFMRDREQAEQELVAMSAETRLSAWILGLLPVCVGGAIAMINASYFARMWHDATGQMMIFGAFGLQIFGALLLYRLARIA
jgi:tight adherence protein B